MNKKITILVALIIAVSAIGLPIYLLNNQNEIIQGGENPDLQVTLKSCEYNSYNEEYDLHIFTVVIHIQPIRFTTQNTFRVQYANISDANEQKQIKSTSINRNNTAEDYTYWFGFSLREINEPVELTLLFSIFETDLTGQTGLAVPNFSKTLRLYPEIIPIEEVEPVNNETENIANVEIQVLYNTSISNYDRVKLTLFSEESGTGQLEIHAFENKNFTGAKGFTINGINLDEGANSVILTSQSLVKMLTECKDGSIIIRHIKEPIEIQILASGLMPPIEYEDIPNP